MSDNETVDDVIQRLHTWDAILTASGANPGYRWKLHDTYPDLPLAPVYFNMRPPVVPEEGFALIATTMAERFDSHSPHSPIRIVAGVPNAADVLAEWIVELNQQRKMRRLRLTKVQTTTGRKVSGIASGQFKPNEHVLLIENVVSRGESCEEAIHVLREGGLIVKQVLTFIDMDLGGRERLAGLGCELIACYEVMTAINQLSVAKLIAVDSLERWLQFRRCVLEQSQ